ncbi:MAGE homology domain-containing protein [Catenaria anguillulae PL171]|uniref:MAGE homology domain-containing protein n=1 Tax=Catenaria anguillulae PL171 TaxID=765915 RepID=A0A1Y2I3V1_9FUNG|nr:MAGE homology domain-containing protein [Catenaria anguillulae PL171]
MTEVADIILDERRLKSLVRLALFSEASRHGLARKDITNHVFFNAPDESRKFPHYLAAANKVMREQFGLELVELPKSGSTKSFVLRNMLSVELRTAVGLPVEDPAFTGITAMVLCLIYVHGSSIRDDELQPPLRRLGIRIEIPRAEMADLEPGAQRQPTNMTYEQLMTLLQKQHYVTREPVKNPQNQIVMGADGKPMHLNKWGSRAFVEFPEERLKAAIAALYGCVPGTPEHDKLMDELDKASSM